MIRIFLSLVFILGLFNCNSSKDSSDYLGQPLPDSIPSIFAPDLVSIKGRFEHGISFTPDNQELAFGILKENDEGEIFHSHKVNGSWTQPKIFKPLKDENVFLPYFSPDGKCLLFAKSIPDAENGITDIWILNKNNSNWADSEKLEPPINTLAREASACMTLDNTIYFSSNRNCDGKENCYTADLFYSKKVNNKYKHVEAISEFISSNDEESVFVSPKEEYIVFCRYTNNKTWMDLYISYQDINKKWLAPIILDSTINSRFWDRRPFISMDNEILFFTQLQIGEKGLIESDIYWVNTQKVFKPFVFNPIIEKVIKIGTEVEISIPSNYFKDIDNNIVEISLNNKEIQWANFNNESMVLTMSPIEIGEFDLVFTALDKYSNKTNDKLKIIVQK